MNKRQTDILWYRIHKSEKTLPIESIFNPNFTEEYNFIDDPLFCVFVFYHHSGDSQMEFLTIKELWEMNE